MWSLFPLGGHGSYTIFMHSEVFEFTVSMISVVIQKFRVLFPQLLASPNSGIFAPGWDVDVAFRPTPSRDLSHCGTQAHGGDGVCPGLSVLLLFLLDHIHLAIYPLTLPTPRPLLQPFFVKRWRTVCLYGHLRGGVALCGGL